jgi:drug/metabolite transporter (DMT)-like permease
MSFEANASIPGYAVPTRAVAQPRPGHAGLWQIPHPAGIRQQLPGPQVFDLPHGKTLTINVADEIAWSWTYLDPLCKALHQDPATTCATFPVGGGCGRPLYNVRMNNGGMTSTPRQPAMALAPILLAFAGIYIIWGTTFVALALAIRSIPPFISGALRFATAGALMYAWLRTREPRPFAGLNIGGCILIGVLMSGIGNGFVIWSQLGLPSGIAALFVGALPVSTLILDWLFFSRRAPSAQSALGVAIGLGGIVVLSSHTHSFSGTVRPLHVISVLTAELGWSAGTLLQPRYVRPARVMNFVCLQMLAGAAFQLLMSVIDREWTGFVPAHVSPQSVLAVGYLVVFGSLVAVNCYSFLVARVPAQKVTTYALVNPVIALALGAVMLGESVTPAAILSGILVLVGVALVLFQRTPLEQEPQPTPPHSGDRELAREPR